MANVRSGAIWLSAVTCVVGCGTDPAAGTWQSEYETNGNRDEFTLSADATVCNEEAGRAELCGSGSFFLPQFCDVLVDATPGDDDQYAVVVFATGCGDDLSFSCTLNDDENQLACDEGKTYKLIASPE
jgi:hypothetical protein